MIILGLLIALILLGAFWELAMRGAIVALAGAATVGITEAIIPGLSCVW